MIAATPHGLRFAVLPDSEDVHRQIADATSKLTLHRMQRDRARMRRLRSQPYLALKIAELLSSRA